MKSIHKISDKILHLLPRRLYLYILFYRMQQQRLRLKNPVRFTHKIQWLKLHGNLEQFARYADKYTVRDYVAKKIGDDFLIPLVGVWDNFDDIAFDELPGQFVLKVTHGCGYNYICKDKSTVDRASLKKLINSWLSEEFYKQEYEMQYKLCQPRIICEQYLEDNTGGLRDYKFYCSKGKPAIIQVDSERFIEHKSDLFDSNWEKIKFVNNATFGNFEQGIDKPANLPEMLHLAERLSGDFPFVRVDLYSVGSKVYFGELTFTPGSGMIQLQPASGDVEFGKLVDLAAYGTL